MANPASPQILGGMDTPGFCSAVAISGTNAYVADGPSGFQVLPAQCKWKKVNADDDVASPNQVDAVRAWPNPSRGNVSLRFDRPFTGKMSLSIHDVAGRLVRGLVTEGRPSMEGVMWDGRDDHGRSVASGTYFVRLRWPEGTATSRVMLIK